MILKPLHYTIDEVCKNHNFGKIKLYKMLKENGIIKANKEPAEDWAGLFFTKKYEYKGQKVIKLYMDESQVSELKNLMKEIANEARKR